MPSSNDALWEELQTQNHQTGMMTTIRPFLTMSEYEGHNTHLEKLCFIDRNGIGTDVS